MNLDWGRVVRWIIGLGVLAYIAKDPHAAGATVSHWANLALGVGQDVVIAIVTFVQNIA